MKPFTDEVRALEAALVNSAIADRSVVKRLSRLKQDEYLSTDARSVSDQLIRNLPVNTPLKVGGAEVPALLSSEITPTIEQIKLMAVMRKAVAYGAELSKLAERGDSEGASRLMDRPPSRRPLADGVAIATAMTGYLALGATSTAFGQVPEPFDDVLLVPGSVVVVAGGPGSGKSALVEQWAWALSTAGTKVLDMSVELDAPARAARYAQHLSGPSAGLRAVMTGTVDHTALGDAARLAVGNPNLIINSEARRLHEVKAAIRHEVAQNGVQVVIIDFIQRIMVDGVSELYERVTRIADELWELGRELGVAMIWCAQLNRNGRAGEVRPTMANIEGSGLVEQLAWDVLIVHNPNPDSKAASQPVTVYRDKARYGPRGLRAGLFTGSHYRFDFNGKTA